MRGRDLGRDAGNEYANKLILRNRVSANMGHGCPPLVRYHDAKCDRAWATRGAATRRLNCNGIRNLNAGSNVLKCVCPSLIPYSRVINTIARGETEIRTLCPDGLRRADPDSAADVERIIERDWDVHEPL